MFLSAISLYRLMSLSPVYCTQHRNLFKNDDYPGLETTLDFIY